jgi:type IV secretion system protein TrbL
MPVDSGVSNDLMTAFSDTITAGFASVAGAVNALFALMIVLVVALTGIYWALSENRAALSSAFSKILLIGFFAYLINDWQALSETLYSGFIELGLMAGGGSISAAEFLNPGAVIETGWDIVNRLGENPAHEAGALDIVGNLIDGLMFALAMLGITIAFAILAIQIVMALIEFKIVTLAGFVLLPFGIWSKSAFMAERPPGYVVSSGLKVLAVALIVSGAQALFGRLIPSDEATIYEALTILTASMMLAMLAMFIPNVAASLITGGPTLGAGAAITSGLALGGAGALATWGAFKAGGMALGAGRALAGGIASASRAAAGALPGPRPGGGGAPALPAPTSPGPGPGPAPSGGGGASAPRAAAASPSPPAPPPARASARPSAPKPIGRGGALNAYLVANTGRQLMPSQEQSGSLSPDIKKEDQQ